ncbi:MAG: zf-TFIIB domain-containing protein [Candidatus Hydrogenedentota bacterium]
MERSDKMICPVCNLDMIVIEHKDIELDYCIQCRGVWFDANELELFCEKSGIQAGGNKIIDLPLYYSKEKKYKCPRCREPMDKIIVGEKKEVVIDRCKKGDGLWFDKGELEQVVEQSIPQTDENTEKILSFIREIF